LPGWQCPTQGITRWEQLPSAAQAYVRRIEVLTGTPVSVISNGPERNALIQLRDPFTAAA